MLCAILPFLYKLKYYHDGLLPQVQQHAKEVDISGKKWLSIIVAIVLAATVFSSGCTYNVGNSTPSPLNTSPVLGYITYGNRSSGFTIQYPSSWHVTQPTEGFTFFNNTSQYNNIGEVSTVTVNKPVALPANTTLSNYSADEISVSSQLLSGFKLLNSSNSTLSGYPSKEYVFMSGPTQSLLVVTVANNTGYTVLYKATQSAYASNL